MKIIDYNKALLILKNIPIINDFAERGIKLKKDYNNQITKNESQKQCLLRI